MTCSNKNFRESERLMKLIMDIKKMIIDFYINIIPIISAVYIISGIKFFKHKFGKKTTYFSLFMFVSALYSLGYYLEIKSLSEETAMFIRNFEYLGVTLLPSYAILFVSELTKTKISMKKRLALFTTSAILWFLYLTHPFHDLFYRKIEFVLTEYGGAIISQKGPAYYLLLSFYGFLLIDSTIMLVKAYNSAYKKNSKKSFIFLLISFQLPWLNVLFILGGYDEFFDITPLTIMIISILFAINEIKYSMFELQISKWRNAFDSVSEPSFLVDEYGEAVCLNLTAKDVFDEFGNDIREMLKDLDNSVLTHKPALLKVKDGVRWYQLERNYFEFKKNYINYFLKDVTEKELAYERLKNSEEQYRLLVTQMNQGLAVHEVITDDFGKVIDYVFISVNKSYERITGLLEKDVVGKTVLQVLPNTEHYWIENYGRVALTGEHMQFENFSSELNKYFNVSAYSPKKNQFAVIITDITESKNREIEIEYLSYYDQLTGLYNRRYFENAVKKLDEKECFPVTLILTDVNGLKLTNDAFGHKIGDILLKTIADILKKECRKSDIVSRIGGDEFVILMPQTNADTANEIIKNINTALTKKKIENLILSISIGYAVRNDLSDDMNDVFKQAEDNMYRHKLSESSNMKMKTIKIIENSLFEKDNREMAHSNSVSSLCRKIASEMNFDKAEIEQLALAGRLHDIGKVAIDKTILGKRKGLNNDEWNEIERHSEIGYRILSCVNEYSNIAEYVLEHHERWDGKGYPKGLKGEEISVQARIIAIADSYASMTSKRVYKTPLSAEKAIIELRKCSGKQFDPNITEIFIEKLLRV